MKVFFSLILITVFMILYTEAGAQENRDMSDARAIRDLQNRLNLTQSQSEAILLLKKDQGRYLDSLGGSKSLTIEDRGKELRKMVKHYNGQVKDILTLDQWEKYKQIEVRTRQEFLNDMKDKKMHIKELD